MKKREMLDRYSELSENRDTVASVSVNALMEMALLPQLDDYDRAFIHLGIVETTTEDAKLDQMEIANLIAVANSTAFELDTRAEARNRVIAMLEL